MTIPNLLSLFRLVSTPCILLALSYNQIKAAAILLGFACITDALDGYIARKWNLESKLGKYLDPLADKILMIGLLLGLYYFQKLHLFLVVIAILRDICIMLGVAILHWQGKRVLMTPLASSKISTILQMSLCCIIIFNWGFTLGISSGIIYDAEIVVALSIVYSFIKYVVIWWKIKVKN